jgi:hypothetical protein
MIKPIANIINKKNKNICIYCKKEIQGTTYNTLYLRNNLIIKVCSECKHN